MPDTIGAKVPIRERRPTNVRTEQTMQVVVVPRHTLSFLSENAAPLVPATQAMRDYHLVPKGAGGVDGGHPAGREIESRGILSDVRLDRDRAVGVKSRFRARFNPYGGLHIGVFAWFDFGIPDEQGLTVRVGLVNLDVAGAARGVGELSGEEFPERTSDVGAARITDRVEPVSAFLFRQDFQFLDGRWFVEIVAERNCSATRTHARVMRTEKGGGRMVPRGPLTGPEFRST